jgi:serine/threonine-protein kinase
MAPEMLSGRADQRTDVYLLGATLHRILTKQARHSGKSEACLISVLKSQPIAYPSELPSDLAALCNAATHVDPEQRVQTAAEFRHTLQDFLRHRESIRETDVAEVMRTRFLDAIGMHADGKSVTRAFVECRYAYVRALSAWSGNARARTGLCAAVEAMAERDFSNRNPDAVDGYVVELETWLPVDTSERLRNRVAEERRGSRQLTHMLMDLDPRVSVHERSAVLIIATVVFSFLVAGRWLLITLGLWTPKPLFAVVGPAVLTLALGGLIAWFRRKVLANSYNRRIISLLVVACCALWFNRAIGIRLGLDPGRIHLLDLASSTLLLAAGSTTLTPRLWPSAGVFASASALAVIWPSYALDIASITALTLVYPARVLARGDRGP